jgi:hypothetical protein
MVKKIIHTASIFIVVLSFLHCKKEYSYEGGNIPVIRDSVIINPAPKPYICSSCVGADNYIEGKWSFYDNGTFYCGIIDTAITTPDRSGFTFFGPSSCSLDSGLVLTISIEPNFLTKDVFNLTTNRTGLYYYDNIGQTHPFVTQPGFTFSFIIDSYIHQTRMMTGRFSGTVFNLNGEATNLFGKYKVKMP